VQTVRGAARSHRSRTSLRDLASIPSTATQSVPRLTPQLRSRYITYAMAVGESVTSSAPSRHCGGKSGGRGFRGPFLSFSSSFARGGGCANEGRACFSSGVCRMKCDDTRSWKVFDERYDTRPSHIHPLQVSKRKACGANPRGDPITDARELCSAVSCDPPGGCRWRIRVTGAFCVHPSQGKQSRHLCRKKDTVFVYVMLQKILWKLSSSVLRRLLGRPVPFVFGCSFEHVEVHLSPRRDF